MHVDANLLRRLARESGCAPSTITRYFADQSLVRGVSRIRIAKALRALGLDAAPANDGLAAPLPAAISTSPTVKA